MSELPSRSAAKSRGDVDPREVSGALHASDGIHRFAARHIAADVAARWPALVRFDGIDFVDTLEQCLFLSFRRSEHSRHNAVWEGMRSSLRVARAAMMGLRVRRVSSDRVAVLIERPIRLKVFEPIGWELVRRGLAPAVIAGVLPELPETSADIMLANQLAWRSIPRLAVHLATLAGARLPLREWQSAFPEAAPGAVEFAVRRSFPAFVMRGAQLHALVRGGRSCALVAFQEVGVWARTIPAVARANRIPSIDLPHAEANDPLGAWRLQYDAILAYGPRSARVLESADIEPSRIHPVGPLRYDALLKAARGRAGRPAWSINEPRRVVYASQPTVERSGLTEPAKRRTYETALALAGFVAPAELIVQPHPNEPIAPLRQLTLSVTPPNGVVVRLRESGDLHEILPNAFALITASSQSVYEATILDVPSVTTDSGSNNVTYADEGFSIAADDPVQAPEIARCLLDQGRRAAVLDKAHAALATRFGELDGNGASRAAAIIAGFVSRRQPVAAPAPRLRS